MYTVGSGKGEWKGGLRKSGGVTRSIRLHEGNVPEEKPVQCWQGRDKKFDRLQLMQYGMISGFVFDVGIYGVYLGTAFVGVDYLERRINRKSVKAQE